MGRVMSAQWSPGQMGQMGQLGAGAPFCLFFFFYLPQRHRRLASTWYEVHCRRYRQKRCSVLRTLVVILLLFYYFGWVCRERASGTRGDQGCIDAKGHWARTQTSPNKTGTTGQQDNTRETTGAAGTTGRDYTS